MPAMPPPQTTTSALRGTMGADCNTRAARVCEVAGTRVACCCSAAMPIPDPFEPESPHIDTRMFEFVERRREEQARARRQRIQLVAIVALGLIGIVLTVSNAILVSRLIARPVTPPAVAPPPVRSAAPVTPVEREP